MNFLKSILILRYSLHFYPNDNEFYIRFLELPAQAVRCTLDGVCPPSTFRLNNGVENLSSYPEEIFYFMARYDGKLAVAVFEHWNAGSVGGTTEAPELQARVVL